MASKQAIQRLLLNEYGEPDDGLGCFRGFMAAGIINLLAGVVLLAWLIWS
jgi:hypothetical protein